MLILMRVHEMTDTRRLIFRSLAVNDEIKTRIDRQSQRASGLIKKLRIFFRSFYLYQTNGEILGSRPLCNAVVEEVTGQSRRIRNGLHGYSQVMGLVLASMEVHAYNVYAYPGSKPVGWVQGLWVQAPSHNTGNEVFFLLFSWLRIISLGHQKQIYVQCRSREKSLVSDTHIRTTFARLIFVHAKCKTFVSISTRIHHSCLRDTRRLA